MRKILLISALMLFLAAPTSSLEASASKLIVQGEGKVSAAPDIAIVVLGVETTSSSAFKAAAENAQLMKQILQALRNQSIKEDDIQTSNYRIDTSRDKDARDADEKTNSIEFIAINQVTAKIRDMEKIGQVIDAALSAGANNVQNIIFEIENPKSEKDQALGLAIEDASRKAKAAAKAAGMKLGKPLEISEGAGFVSGSTRAMAYSELSTEIQSGKVDVTAAVTITYELL